MRATSPTSLLSPLALLALAACSDPSSGAGADLSTNDAGGVDAEVVGSSDAGTDATVSVDGAADAGRDSPSADATPPGRPFFVIGGQDLRHLVSADGKTWNDDTYVAPNGLDNAYSGAAIG